MSEQFLLSIAPIVSLLVIVGIVGIYLLWKEHHEDPGRGPADKN